MGKCTDLFDLGVRAGVGLVVGVGFGIHAGDWNSGSCANEDLAEGRNKCAASRTPRLNDETSTVTSRFWLISVFIGGSSLFLGAPIENTAMRQPCSTDLYLLSLFLFNHCSGCCCCFCCCSGRFLLGPEHNPLWIGSWPFSIGTDPDPIRICEFARDSLPGCW